LSARSRGNPKYNFFPLEIQDLLYFTDGQQYG
jgi:hypothetical protein